MPSTIEKIEERGFNHLEEILSDAKVGFHSIISKTSGPDQKDLTAEERKKVGERLFLNKKVDLTGKRVILFDDVLTTGSTLKASYALVKKLNPKSVTGLVLMNHEFKRDGISQ